MSATVGSSIRHTLSPPKGAGVSRIEVARLVLLSLYRYNGYIVLYIYIYIYIYSDGPLGQLSEYGFDPPSLTP